MIISICQDIKGASLLTGVLMEYFLEEINSWKIHTLKQTLASWLNKATMEHFLQRNVPTSVCVLMEIYLPQNKLMGS